MFSLTNSKTHCIQETVYGTHYGTLTNISVLIVMLIPLLNPIECNRQRILSDKTNDVCDTGMLMNSS